jgi:peptide/nickel transport system ATP-binding protein
MPKVLQISDLSVSFATDGHRRVALQDVSLSVEEGETLGVIGESGSGKSTILRAILGLAPVLAGDIRLGGQDVRAMTRMQLARCCQMVFQDPYGSLHPHFTVDRILREPLIIHRIADADRLVVETLRSVGLDESYLGRYPHQLSGGQRQRVAIARVLPLRPALLLLDEPTSSLDVSVEAEILALLREIRRHRAKLSWIFVSHDLGVVGRMCDRVAVIRDGRLIEERDAGSLGESTDPYTRLLVSNTQPYRRKRSA